MTLGIGVASIAGMSNVMSKAFVLGVCAYTLVACTVQGRTRAYVEPVSTVEVTSAPVVTYDAYPHTVYEGRTVYYIDNRWGYPRGERWVYYQSEPPPLARHRTRVQAAPPAPRRYAPATSAPPAVRAR